MNIMDIIDAMKVVCSKISLLVRQMEPHKLGEESGQSNESCEMVKDLDLRTNMMIKSALEDIPDVKYLSSEEEANLIDCNAEGKYLVAFDPLDGSSNIDCNAPIGTIFGIYEDLKIIAAGYCLYGGSTQFVYSFGNGLIIEQLIGHKWQIIKQNYLMPKRGKYFSVNIANKRKWEGHIQQLVEKYIDNKYGLRYIGSLVGDGHRTLIKGGVFMYPGDSSNVNGKLRQYYEVVPFAFLFEAAGGLAMNDKYGRILEEEMNEDLHYRRPIMLMGKYDFIHI